MRRRTFLATAGLAATAGCSVLRPGPAEGAVEAVEVDTIDAPGSTAGTATVPALGTVSLVDLFATWCGPCRAQMDALAAAHEEVGDVAQFVSVTGEALGNGFTRRDVAAWWREHDGAWTVAHDPGGGLPQSLGASGLPYTVVTDARRRPVWTHRGVAAPETVVEEVRAAADG